MNPYLLVALGGAIGSVARYACTEWVQARVGGGFPWGTLLVNVVGGLVIGAIAGWHEGGREVSLSLRQFLMVGVLGGFTTFSSFSLQTLMLLRDGEWMLAVANAVGSVVLCLLAAWAGMTLAR